MLSFEDFAKVYNAAANDDEAHAKLPPGGSPSLHALYMSLQAMLGGETAAKVADDPNTVFVIEASSSAKAKPMMFAIDDKDGIWTSDPAKAAQFLSQEDAEMVAQANGLKSVKYREVPA